MTIESLIAACAELGIKLELAGDDNDRLKVDAPKGALTPAMRDVLTASKPDLIAFLRNQQAPAELSEGETETVTPPKSPPPVEIPPTRTPHLSEAKPLIDELPPSMPSPPIASFDVEASKLSSVAGGPAEQKDLSRQAVAAQLIAILGGRNYDQHHAARRAFMDHGHFDDVTTQLRTADSPGERAAAARKLGVIRDPAGTSHLIEALTDTAPEVRRAATESLGQLGDPVRSPRSTSCC